MSDPRSETAASAAPAASDAADETTGSTPPTPRQWIRVAAGNMPATWVVVAGTLVFLGSTAAFGGLADAPKPEPTALPVLAAGDTHTSEQFEITVERAVLIDDLAGSGTIPEEGERVLAVLATMENVTTEPLPTSQSSEVIFTIDALPEETVTGKETTNSIARFDDSTLGPYLQPDVPVEVVLTWPVPADLLSEGETLRVTLSDYHRYEWVRLGGSEDAYSWEDPAPAAYVDIVLEDVGAGADSEEDAG